MRSTCFLLKLISSALLSVILSVGVIGVSYSYFTDTQTISSSASMGNIDVVFTGLNVCQVNAEDPACVTDAQIADNGKHIEINIENASPGYTSTINYEVTNNGTVPVAYQLNSSGGAEGPVQLNVSGNNDYICGNGGKSQGQINVKVSNDIGDCKSYTLCTELNFQQAIVEIS